ncbi:hypothetical protein MKW98_010174 [Papaver atlanticum]|uniref:Membralin n=1 Tax=Papaver atlanticum TaxID=357466 RepID=A0AAD4RXM4_9MAGN|nr:hypothetical protein MKW98_010174 [Papaver atlanticum]
MDPEQTFIRVQERFSQMLTPRIRATLEYFYLIVAVFLFCLLVVMHANYVQQPGCSSELSLVETSDAQLVHIKITSIVLLSASESDEFEELDHQLSTENLEVPNVNGDGLMSLGAKFWSHLIGSGARRSRLVLKSWKTDSEYVASQGDSSVDSGSRSKTDIVETDIKVDAEDPDHSLPVSAMESVKSVIMRLCGKWHRRFSSLWVNVKHLLWSISQLRSIAGINGINMPIDVPKWLHMFHLDKINSFAVQWLEKRGRSFEPTYLYTVEKGYFLLSEDAKSRSNIRTVNISISARHSCLGNRWQQLIINRFVGYDTILMNSLLSSPGQGYLYNYQTKEFYDLSYAREVTEGSTKLGDYLVTKCGVLIMSLFVFFTTTMSVSFTLRETQTRMLKFTVQLQHHARHQLPTFQLIFVHVIESLVFVPIMIGILFFLFEFYDDQLLAFMVLILVWLCELFTLISVRTPISMKFFPRFFLLYFLVFHIYFFSYTYGFSYLAFATTAVFMQHLILYFWNRFEVPALQRFIQNRRTHFQQQPNIHITSSTILASTLHIARLNMRNPVPVPLHVNNQHSTEHAQRPDSTAVPAPVTVPAGIPPNDTGAGALNERPNNSQLQSQERPPPTTGAANTSLLNPISSLLLGILGGASSESLSSFRSLFRDVRDNQGQIYPDSPRQQEINNSSTPPVAPARQNSSTGTTVDQ